MNSKMFDLKALLGNGLVQFFAAGMVIIKAIWDGFLLGQADQASFLAFGFVFPIVILMNTIAVSLANATVATFSKLNWVGQHKIDRTVFFGLSIFALIAGILVSELIELLMPLLVKILAADAYKKELEIFGMMLIVWIPFQFLVSIWLSIARGAGQYKLSGGIAAFSYGCGMLISYWLLVVDPSLVSTPIVAVVCSSSITALLLVLWIWKAVWQRFTFYLKIGLKELYENVGRPFLDVFNSTFTTNLFALVFIFVLTRLLAQQGESVIGAMVYLTRLEQLILVMYGGFINVLLPELAHLAQKKAYPDALDYTNRGSRFLLIMGAIVISLLYIGVNHFTPQEMKSTDLFETFIYMSVFWFVGLFFQGATIFILQLINIVVEPKLAPKLNFLRFIIIALPVLYIAEFYFGLKGILFSMVFVQSVSYFLFALLFRKKWKVLQAENLDNQDLRQN